mmetsp:Transcript_10087/g.27020  ORF Transcript_10087/g.27020 Transcript_10087/m.27020 type:complete len:217 (-) Transcript_10087:66-716(-)
MSRKRARSARSCCLFSASSRRFSCQASASSSSVRRKASRRSPRSFGSSARAFHSPALMKHGAPFAKKARCLRTSSSSEMPIFCCTLKNLRPGMEPLFCICFARAPAWSLLFWSSAPPPCALLFRLAESSAASCSALFFPALFLSFFAVWHDGQTYWSRLSLSANLALRHETCAHTLQASHSTISSPSSYVTPHPGQSTIHPPGEGGGDGRWIGAPP